MTSLRSIVGHRLIAAWAAAGRTVPSTAFAPPASNFQKWNGQRWSPLPPCRHSQSAPQMPGNTGRHTPWPDWVPEDHQLLAEILDPPDVAGLQVHG